ncbi:MAG: LysR substrate-binding domain-containing protein [Oscillochloridaceae bacterium umkhey_bin13]
MFILDLYKLEIFARVAEAGSLSQAANQLRMTQSGVSQHVKALEDGLGTPLFERGRRGVRLTVAGRRLYDYSEAIFRLVAEAELAVTDVTGLRQGQLTLGATPGVSAYLLPDWAQEFAGRYPNLTLTAQTATTATILSELRAGQIELAVIEGELEASSALDLRIQTLQAFDQLLVVGRRHPWWERTEVTLSELSGQPIVMRQAGSQTRIWLDQTLREHGLSPKVVAELDNLESIKRMVMLGVSTTILPFYVVRAEHELELLRALPLTGRPLQRTLRLISRAGRPLSPLARTFIQLLSSLPIVDRSQPIPREA